MPIEVLHDHPGTPEDPIPVPVLPGHADQAKALRLRVKMTSGYGPDALDLNTISADSEGIWVLDAKDQEKIPGGVIETFLVYLTEELVGKPDTVTFRARKYGAKAPNGARISGKEEGSVTVYFEPIREEPPSLRELAGVVSPTEDTVRATLRRIIKALDAEITGGLDV